MARTARLKEVSERGVPQSLTHGQAGKQITCPRRRGHGTQQIELADRYGIRLGLTEPLVLLELAGLADQLLLGIAEVAGGASIVVGAD